MRWLHAARARIALLFPRGAEARMRQEFGFHVDMEAERLVRAGVEPAEARRRAMLTFGGMDRYGEELREGRGLSSLNGLSLDLRLGLRMLVKYPGLTVVGGLGMAVAIGIAAVSFGMVYEMMDPALPLPEGDGIVIVQNLDATHGNPDRGTHLHDLEVWRERVGTVSELSAFRTLHRNLVQGDGGAELVRVAEMSSSGFTLARVAPIQGRALLPSDEAAGATDVVVIGEAVWRKRFAADAGIVGRTIRLGSREHVVVGVMPAGFRFPVNHEFWIPLRLSASAYERGAAPSIDVFGRLAEGASLADARKELASTGRSLAVSYPATHGNVSTRVMPFTHPFFDVDAPGVAWAFHLLQLLVTLLLVVVGVNVAILTYARTTTRLGEITVRSALGASRRRIVLQLFAEALVLAALSAALGLALAAYALNRLATLLHREFGSEMPFWFDPRLSPGMTMYVAGLTVLAAVIVGAAPALKATSRSLQSRLRTLGSGSTGMQLGRTWTLLVVGQVAVAMAVLPAAVHNAMESVRFGMSQPDYPAHELMQADVSMELPATPAGGELAPEETRRFAEATSQLVDRLEAEPGVAGVTYAHTTPSRERSIRVELQDGAQSSVLTLYNRVAPDYFATFGMRLLAGTGFGPVDASDASTAVVVNRAFVEELLGGAPALGRIIRYTPAAGEWEPHLRVAREFEIVGVVSDFPHGPRPDTPNPTLYRPLAAGDAFPTTLFVRLQGDASGFERTLRHVALATSVLLEIDDPLPMDDAGRQWRNLMRMIAAGVLLATLSVTLLSAAGIYAMMSFTVARRRREIGIRAALGAPPAQLLRAVFARAAAQLAAGVVIGLAVSALLDSQLQLGYRELLAPVAALMLMVGMLAALGPARRGLRIQPTEALRED